MSEHFASPKKLLIATTNLHKLREIQTLLEDLDMQFFSLKDFPHVKEIKETGKTFRENAGIKALGYARQTGLLTLAEDSGLCCDALEGAPGVYSARFAGTGKDDYQNNLKVLKLLEKVPDNCRGAYFVSAIAVATPEKIFGVMEGVVHGVIAHEIRGNQGFGYDPLFYYPSFGKTFGEVPAEMKNKASHRAQALQKTRKFFEEHLSSNGDVSRRH